MYFKFRKTPLFVITLNDNIYENTLYMEMGYSRASKNVSAALVLLILIEKSEIERYEIFIKLSNLIRKDKMIFLDILFT